MASKAPLKEIDFRVQDEIREAKSIQKQTGCTWGEALRIAGEKNHTAARSVPPTCQHGLGFNCSICWPKQK